MTLGNGQQALGNSKKPKLAPYALCALLFALCFPAEAQQPKRIPRIGYISGRDASSPGPLVEAGGLMSYSGDELTCFAAPPHTWTRSSRAPNRLICRCSRRQSLIRDQPQGGKTD